MAGADEWDLDKIGLPVLVLATAGGVMLVPDLDAHLLTQPSFWAVVSACLLLAAVVSVRARIGRGTSIERIGLGAFLFLMPTVYLAAWVREGGEVEWLWIELVGQVLFGVAAVYGAMKSPLVLAIGIAAHGLLWDTWHHGQTTFMPDWYATACLVVDVGWGFYAYAQVRAWRNADT